MTDLSALCTHNLARPYLLVEVTIDLGSSNWHDDFALYTKCGWTHNGYLTGEVATLHQSYWLSLLELASTIIDEDMTARFRSFVADCCSGLPSLSLNKHQRYGSDETTKRRNAHLA